MIIVFKCDQFEWYIFFLTMHINILFYSSCVSTNKKKKEEKNVFCHKIYESCIWNFLFMRILSISFYENVPTPIVENREQ